MGNETVKDDDAAKDYYHVRMSRFDLSSSLSQQLGKRHTLSIGVGFQSVKLGNNEGRFVESSAKLDSSDFDRKNYGSVQISYSFNNTDNALYPRKGVKINTRCSLHTERKRER
jgi:outer membrane protein assembly factor BamA